jgi:succinate dehydrogenase/fumarate reductase cytochrome b subunit
LLALLSLLTLLSLLAAAEHFHASLHLFEAIQGGFDTRFALIGFALATAAHAFLSLFDLLAEALKGVIDGAFPNGGILA